MSARSVSPGRVGDDEAVTKKKDAAVNAQHNGDSSAHDSHGPGGDTSDSAAPTHSSIARLAPAMIAAPLSEADASSAWLTTLSSSSANGDDSSASEQRLQQLRKPTLAEIARKKGREVEMREKQVKELSDQYDQRQLAELACDFFDQNASLEAECAMLKKQLEVTRSTHDSLAKTAAANAKRVEELTNELANSRAFVDKEDADDVDSVVAALVQINEAIDDWTFTTVELYETASNGDQLLHFENIFALREDESIPKEAAIIAKLLENNENALMMDVLTPCLFTLIVRTMYEHIFQPFEPGLLGPEYEPIRLMLANANQKEPQERLGRWRSITYRNLAPQRRTLDLEIARALAQDIVEGFEHLMRVAYIDDPVPRPRVGPNLKGLENLIVKAINWRHKTQTLFLSAEYEVVLEPREKRVNTEKEGGEPYEVTALYAFGLQTHENVEAGAKINRRTKVLIEPSVKYPDDFW